MAPIAAGAGALAQRGRQRRRIVDGADVQYERGAIHLHQCLGDSELGGADGEGAVVVQKAEVAEEFVELVDHGRGQADVASQSHAHRERAHREESENVLDTRAAVLEVSGRVELTQGCIKAFERLLCTLRLQRTGEGHGL